MVIILSFCDEFSLDILKQNFLNFKKEVFVFLCIFSSLLGTLHWLITALDIICIVHSTLRHIFVDAYTSTYQIPVGYRILLL